VLLINYYTILLSTAPHSQCGQSYPEVLPTQEEEKIKCECASIFHCCLLQLIFTHIHTTQEDAGGYKQGKSSLSPEGELYKVPRLEKQFKKPPPHRNRRRPTKAHLKQMASPGSGGDEVDTFKSPPPRDDEMSQVSEFESDDAPSAPPLSPRMYPDLPSSDTERENGGNFQVPVTPLRYSSEINQQRHHTFFKKTLVKVETCQVCNKKVKFGQKCLKCRDCRAVCHPECETKVPLPCVPSVPTPKKRFHDADLAAFCPTTVPRLPALIVHCITEIEKRGLTQVGIYRVPGYVHSITNSNRSSFSSQEPNSYIAYHSCVPFQF